MLGWARLALLFVPLFISTPAAAQGARALVPDSLRARPLRVAVKDAPPFAFRGEGGRWEGISVTIWSRTADALGLRYEFHEADIPEMLEGLSSGRLDVATAALTVTAEREHEVDFSLPIATAGLGIAVRPSGSGWIHALDRLISATLLRAIVALGVLLLLAGFLVWLFERRRNPDHFGGPASHGIGSGFWWAAVTLTTVGYGDKAPVTPAGRAVALVWMFSSLVVISAFTAAITSAVTVGQLSSTVRGIRDLPHVRVGTVSNTASADYLAGREIGFRELGSLEETLRALADDELDAVVYDIPILKHWIRTRVDRGLEVLPEAVESQHYAWAFPPESPLREPVNRELLRLLEEPSTRRLFESYLGD